MAPEYVVYGHLTEKADVFSYGVLILEIVTGKRCGSGIGTHGGNLPLAKVIFDHVCQMNVMSVLFFQWNSQKMMVFVWISENWMDFSELAVKDVGLWAQAHGQHNLNEYLYVWNNDIKTYA